MQMTVSELPNRRNEPDFERTPPQDLAAEQSVLGGMMLFFIVTLVMNKFLFPRVVHFLDSRAAAAGTSKSSRRRTR